MAGDLAALVGLPLTQVTGTEVAVSPTTDLNVLPANVVDYQVGDVIETFALEEKPATLE